MQYVKLISEIQIDYAPTNKGNIINYNIEANETMLFEDGYKRLIIITPPKTDRYYRIIYQETSPIEISEVIRWDETEKEYNIRKLEEAKANKREENTTKREAIDRIKAQFSETLSGYLLKQTPVGDIMTIVMGLCLPAIVGHQPIPEGSMRYYDDAGEPHLTPIIEASFVPTFYQVFSENIAKIDTYSTIVELQINTAKTIEEVEAIEINYSFDNVEQVVTNYLTTT